MGFDLQKMMKQAQKMQEQMSSIQDELEDIEVTGTAGGGAVSLTTNAKFDPRKVKLNITPELLEDPSMLEDLILAAMKDLNKKVTEVAEQKMSALTAGLNLPGFKLPGF